jgi:glutathione S-transferase
MKAIVSLTSPYARKIRVILLEKKLACDEIVDLPHEPTAKVGDFNPLGKVPTLITDDGEVFFDSPVIADYLETLGAEPALLPGDPLAAVRVKQLEALADGVLDAAVIVLLEGRRAAEQQSEAVKTRQWGKIEKGLAALQKLATGKTWLLGDRLSLADISVAVMVGWLDARFPDYGIATHYPQLAAWAKPVLARPSFQATTPAV